MVLKNYQSELLDAYSSYLARTREVGPDKSFRESTLKHFGHELPYRPLQGADAVPYVCLRVPTGGGKTLIGGHSIRRVLDSFLATENALILWLVPSDAVREQTLYGLKTPGELLHSEMRDLFGKVEVLNIAEALSVQPSTLNTTNSIIVATMQSFKRDTPDGLRVYRQNGALMPHFDKVPIEMKGEESLVDVIRNRRPFVIVDEAHNQGTALAVDTLVKLNPSCILELTATPDRAINPSNVLRSISAATLQSEDMLKLPLELAISSEWQVALREAVNRVRELEKEAEEERRQTGEEIKPVVMLIQAESRQQGQVRFTPDVVKQHLIDDFNIAAESIAIEYRDHKELEGKRLGDPDFPQFVITVDKLREGWDCPYAYVLFSFRNTTSATAVEQVLGRVLRMPHVTRKQKEALNRSYAYVVSSELAATVQSLKDGLVQSGFERIEAQDLIYAPANEDGAMPLFDTQTEIVITLPDDGNAVSLPDNESFAMLPQALRTRVEISPEFGTLTIKQSASPAQIKQIADTFTKPEIAQAVRERLDTASANAIAPSQGEKSPAEQGRVERVPLLSYTQGKLFDVFDETPLLDADWEIDEFDQKLTEGDFAKDVEAMRRASLDIAESERVVIETYDQLDRRLALFDTEGGWDVVNLVTWLDRNVQFVYAERDQKVAWINAVVNYLIDERRFSLEELAFRKFRLRGAISRKLFDGLVRVKQRVFVEILNDESRFEVRDEHSVIFEQGRYAYDYRYTGPLRLKRHFFPVIGNLKDSGEEFQCAQEIANFLPNVEWWVRNVERKPGSFWLQTATDKFYPDFIIRLYGGVTIAAEYKGSHLADSRDSREKRQIGQLWERRSNGKSRFVWLENQNWQPLRDAAA